MPELHFSLRRPWLQVEKFWCSFAALCQGRLTSTLGASSYLPLIIGTAGWHARVSELVRGGPLFTVLELLFGDSRCGLWRGGEFGWLLALSAAW